jgi:IS605 OrfB family transposase
LGVLPPENLCANLWKRIKSLEKELVETISHSIVEIANDHNCNVIVFENLKSLKPQRGKYSRRSNAKRSFWVANKIQKRVEQKALNRHSIYTVRVNPAFTSITDSRSGGKCLRGSQVGSLNLYLWNESGLGKLVKTPDGKILCSGENAARNIGLKYLAAKFEKPVVFKNAGLLTGCVAWLIEPVGKGKVVIPAWSCL